ncbi:MAG TPA: LiaF domain-containing protein [Longimicrobium sp.]
MSRPEPLHPVPLEQTRERTIAELCRGFALEHIDADQLQSRLDAAQRASTVDQLRALVADIPAEQTPQPVASAGMQLAHPSQVSPQQTIVAVMAGATRKGAWTPSRQLNVIAVMGGAELDFREARMPPGITELNVFAWMGGVEVIVPPGVRVEMNGIALMGGFEEHSRTLDPPPPDAPVLRVGGFALMGGVEVSVRHPGETARDARQRHREHRRIAKEQRRLGR